MLHYNKSGSIAANDDIGFDPYEEDYGRKHVIQWVRSARQEQGTAIGAATAYMIRGSNVFVEHSRSGKRAYSFYKICYGLLPNLLLWAIEDAPTGTLVQFANQVGNRFTSFDTDDRAAFH